MDEKNRRTWIGFVREIMSKSVTLWYIDVWLRFSLTRVLLNDVCMSGFREEWMSRIMKEMIGMHSWPREQMTDYTFNGTYSDLQSVKIHQKMLTRIWTSYFHDHSVFIVFATDDSSVSDRRRDIFTERDISSRDVRDSFSLRNVN